MDLQLAYYGDPILRQKAQEVGEIDEEIKALVAAMIDVMDQKSGIGLAAPQVSKSLRIFIIRQYDKGTSGDIGEPQVFINPKLSYPSQEILEDEEGCLSVPGVYAEIERPAAITVEAQDLEGNFFTKTFHGYPAREIMHENDHLNGVLFIDRMMAKERKEIDQMLKKLKKKLSKKKWRS
ncbi:MAG: peptide deformylase [Chlamydiota bacterium]